MDETSVPPLSRFSKALKSIRPQLRMFHLTTRQHHSVLLQKRKAVIHLTFKARSGNFQSVGNVDFCAEPEPCVREDVFEAVQSMHLR